MNLIGNGLLLATAALFAISAAFTLIFVYRQSGLAILTFISAIVFAYSIMDMCRQTTD